MYSYWVPLNAIPMWSKVLHVPTESEFMLFHRPAARWLREIGPSTSDASPALPRLQAGGARLDHTAEKSPDASKKTHQRLESAPPSEIMSNNVSLWFLSPAISRLRVRAAAARALPSILRNDKRLGEK